MRAKFAIWVALTTLIIGLTSCGVESPEFRSIRNLEMLTLEDGNFLLKANADMYNPNRVSLTIKEIHVDVIVNGEGVGTVDQFIEQEVPKREEFSLPLEVKFPPKTLFKNLLAGLFSAASGQDFEIEYVGYVRTKVLGMTFKVPVKSKSKLKLN